MDIDELHDLVELIENDGQISIGSVGPHPCAAVANDEYQMYAALVRRDGESIGDLLVRLDAAVKDAVENETYIDEIN